MNKLLVKYLGKRTQRVHRYGHTVNRDQFFPTIETDPTNTTITVLTTVSGSTHFDTPQPPLKKITN